MNRLDQFDEGDLERIRLAVAAAESRSGGEVVTYIVPQADAYPEVGWKGATVGALLAVPTGALLMNVATPGTIQPWLTGLLAAGLGSGLGWSLVQAVAPLKRLLLGPTLALRAAARAEQAFLEEEVFASEKRNGVLLFVALFERRVLILADEALHTVISGAEWEALADEVAHGLATGAGTDAVIRGIEAVGALVEAATTDETCVEVDELTEPQKLRES